MLENEQYDLAIIGGGPGGLSASIYAHRSSLKTILLEHGLPGGQVNSTYEVENYPGVGRISGSELATNFLNHASSYGLNLVRSEVSKLTREGNLYKITLASGEVVQSKTVILATGGHPRKLRVPGENELYGNGVSYCATCDGFFFRNKDVLVIGGGDSAAEESIHLSKLCRKVYLVHRGDNLRASNILRNKVTKNSKITILWNTEVKSIMAGSNGVSGSTLISKHTGEEKKIDIDGIFILIGYEPNNQLFPEGLALDDRGLVLTDDNCETNIPGIYAIGDIRSKPARQIILSAADGCNAALAVARRIG